MTAVLAAARVVLGAVLVLACAATLVWAVLIVPGIATVAWFGILFVIVAGSGVAWEWAGTRRRKEARDG